MSDVAFLRETELALMNAPFEANGWSRAIQMVAQATGSQSANLVAIGGPVMLPLNLFVGPNSDMSAAYFSRPELWGECNWRVQSAGQAMSVQHDAHYAAARQRGRTADYDDAVSDLDIQYGCQSALISDESTFLGLAILRGRREGRCDEIVLKRFQHLIRHVQRSLRVQLALDGEASRVMIGDLESVDGQLFLLDRHGCVTEMTVSAESLVDGDGPVRLRGLAFELRHPEEHRSLQQALARLLDPRHGPNHSAVHVAKVGRTLARPAGRWRLTAMRLPEQLHGLGFDPHLAISFQPLDRV